MNWLDIALEKLGLLYNDWVDAVETRIEIEQYFVATVYALSGIFGAILAVFALVGIIMKLFGLVGYTIFGLALIFALTYRSVKKHGERKLAEAEEDTSDDDDDPQFV